MAAFDVRAFRPLDDFKAEVTEFAQYLRSTPTATGVEQVYYPGEIEHLRTKKNLTDGIELAEATFAELCKLASELSIELPRL